jgi:hypothetical protein
MIAPDSSVWIEYFNGGKSSRTDILERGEGKREKVKKAVRVWGRGGC